MLGLLAVLALARGPEPDTQCPRCWLAEAGPGWKIASTLGMGGPQRSALFDLSGVFGVMLGQAPASWYDRHRADFERDGRPVDLTRMLRHVDQLSVNTHHFRVTQLRKRWQPKQN
jgi:hypothetical protein